MSGPRDRTPRGLRCVSKASATVLLLVTMIGAVSAWGATRLEIRVDTASLVPKGDAAAETLRLRDEQFGADPVVVLIESADPQGILLSTDQLRLLVGLEGDLARLPNVASVFGPGTVLNQTAGGIRNVLLTVAGQRDALQTRARMRVREQGGSRRAQEEAAQRAVVALDRRYGALLAAAMPMGLPTLNNERFVASVMLDERGNPKERWQLLLPSATSVALFVRPTANLDRTATEELVDSVRTTVDRAGLDAEPVTVSGVPVITSEVSDDAIRELPVTGFVALGAVCLVFFLMPWSRRRRHRLLPVASALLGAAVTVGILGWLGQPVSVGAVAFLPVLAGLGCDFPLYAFQRLHRWKLAGALMGAVGALGSLGLSPIPFVREFGLTLALGIVLTTTIALALTKAVDVTPVSDGVASGDERNGPPRRVAAALVAVGLVVVAGYGWLTLTSNPVESDPEALIGGGAAATDAETVRGALGFANEVTIVVHGDDVLQPDVLKWATSAQGAIVSELGDAVHPLLTVSDVLKPVRTDATPGEVQAASELLPAYLLDAVVSPNRKTALLTFGVEPASVDQQRALIQQIDALLPAAPEGYETSLTGLPVVASNGLDELEDARISANLIAIAIAAFLVGVVDRRRGITVAAASLMATGVVVAGMRLAGVDFNPLTVYLGAFVAVTSCEFTTVLAARDQLGRQPLWRGAMTVVLAGTVGYLVLSLSDLPVIRSFGLVLSLSVAASFVSSWSVVCLAEQVRLKGTRPEDPTTTDELPAPLPRALTHPELEEVNR